MKKDRTIEEMTKEINDHLDTIDENLSDIDEIVQELNYKFGEPDKTIIKDIDDFIYGMTVNGLYTKEIEEFIEYYLKYKNK